MDVKDLMIGDWVQKREGDHFVNVQVSGIFDNAVNYLYRSTKGTITVNGIIPIPLTPEILEKNFEKKGHRYGIYDDYFSFELYEYNDGTWVAIYHCCEMQMPDEQLMICFVHQLQHALRLCGIEKEIVL